MGESYAKLIIQPIDLIRAFKLEFCLASVIKWLTKWHMERKSECLARADYYIALCESIPYSKELLFALRLYCIVNGFMPKDSSSCMLFDVVKKIMEGKNKDAQMLLVNGICN